MQPDQYSIGHDFSQDEADAISGRSTIETAGLDAELNNIATSLNSAITNLGLIQRDDGELRDSMVKLHALATEVIAVFTAGLTIRGTWVTTAVYAVKDVVNVSGETYLAALAHTSGTFATDKAAGKWILLASSIASLLTQALARDGSNSPSANLPMAGFRHTGAGTAILEDEYLRLMEFRNQTPLWCGTFGGTANALTGSVTPAITSYAAGQKFVGLIGALNTGPATLNISSIGIKNITKSGVSPLAAGDLPVLSVASFIYDGTQFQLSGAGGLRFIDAQTFEANGTWTKPAGTVAVDVEVQDGGGGGSGADAVTGECLPGRGGSAGGYRRKFITGAFGDQTITIGAGGAAGVGSGSGTGGDGGVSSFGSQIPPSGGAGGVGGVAGTSGTSVATFGGTGASSPTGGDINIPGGSGGGAIRLSATTGLSGNGGDSMFGFGGRASNTSASPGQGYGSGGGAGISTGPVEAGAVGASGLVIVRAYGL